MKPGALPLESTDRPFPAAHAATRPTRYSGVAVALHWLVAVLVLSTIPLGLFGASSPPPAGPPGVRPDAGARPPAPPPKSAAQQAATNVHKTIGIVILALTLLRIGWRLGHPVPALPAAMAPALRRIARASHALFYVLLVVMPLTGWWMSSAIPNPMRHPFGFGVVDIPFLPVPQNWPSAFVARLVHVNLAWLMIGLALLHILAALKHHVVDRDDVLRRMLPRTS